VKCTDPAEFETSDVACWHHSIRAGKWLRKKPRFSKNLKSPKFIYFYFFG